LQEALMREYMLRLAQPSDAAFLWTMLFYAARMEEDGALAPDAAQTHPFLQQYVADWGRPSDLGVLAYDHNTPIGAAWSRLLPADAAFPELAIAVAPAYLGRGVGSGLLAAYLEYARGRFAGVTLSVRAESPAVRLYQRFGFTITGELTNRVGTRSYAMLLTIV
jgi:ribosomal protein S18 acetylase RimI-like enzyme